MTAERHTPKDLFKGVSAMAHAIHDLNSGYAPQTLANPAKPYFLRASLLKRPQRPVHDIGANLGKGTVDAGDQLGIALA
jgi:hypothetical protein